VLEAVMAPDFLDQVDLAMHVHSPRRAEHCPAAVPRRRRLETQGGQDPFDCFVRHVHAEQSGNTIAIESNGLRLIGSGVDVGDADRCSGANLLQQLARADDCTRRGRDVHAALEAHRRLGLEPELLARCANRSGLEVRGFERDPFRRVRHLRVRAAHHTGDVFRVLRIRDDQHLCGQRPLLAIQRRHGLAGLCPPRLDNAAAHLLQIERVHRLPELEHHVVGDVHDVADRTHATHRQPILHPLR
jgi:hypothetical protein